MGSFLVFSGDYEGTSQDQRYKEPIYSPDKKIIVFDYDDLIVLHKREYRNGAKTNSTKTRYHNQAKKVVERAIKDFNKVVFWSAANLEVLTNLNSYPFSEASLKVCGASFLDNRLIKDLRKLTSNLNKVVSFEDAPEFFDKDGIPESGFFPRERVIEVSKHDNFMMKYEEAFMLLRRNSYCE